MVDDQIDVELKIKCSLNEAQGIINALQPDNTDTMSMNIEENTLVIRIARLKATSLYNVLDDILRNYEVYKNVAGGTE